MRQNPAHQKPAAKREPSHSLRVGKVLLVTASCFLCSCASHEQAIQQGPPPAQTEAATEKQMSQLSSPKPVEVQEAVKRVFNEAAIIDSTHNPNFIAGDFNGDNSQDIAVILKPAPDKLSAMNQDSPPWILRDLRTPTQTGQPPLRITGNEVLLAVIHGYGAGGWRDPQATQTYLLKNAVGSDVKLKSKSDFLIANQSKKLPRLFGDLIGEVLKGSPGYLYFADATYSWYDPKTFKGEPDRRVVHPGMETRTDKPDLLNLKTKKEIAAEK